MSSDGTVVSISKLSAIHDRIKVLRVKLTGAFVDLGPRLQISIYEDLVDIFENVLRNFFSEDCESRDVELVEARLVILYYLQDLLAAALYLGDENCPSVQYSIESLPQPPSVDLPSKYYVSKSQRLYSTQLFVFLCWCRWIPLHVIIQALYPLIDTTTAVGAVPDGSLENNIAPNMLQHFQTKKEFLVAVLNGLVLSRPNGVRSLLRVLLLNDRVGSDMSASACEHIVRLLNSTMSPAWVKEGSSAIVSLQAVSSERQVQASSSQFVSLFEEHSEPVGGADPPPRFPTFLRNLRTTNCVLPMETLEERLHLCLTLWLNRSLTLPGRDSAEHKFAYRRFFFVNKYFLTPAFRALSLRGKAVSERELAASLRRLLTIAKGCECGAAPTALLTVLEATTPGLLNACALANPPVALRQLTADVCRCIVRAPLHDILAHVLVQGCRKMTAVTLTADNKVEKILSCVQGTCPRSVLHEGAKQIVYNEEAPSLLKSSFFCAMIDDCEAHLYGVGVESLWAPGGTDAQSDTSLFLTTIENACVECQAESLFGPQTTLSSVVSTLCKLLPLSMTCFRWAVRLLPDVLAPELLEVNAGQQLRSAEQTLEKSRLSKAITTYERILDDLELERRIVSAGEDPELTDNLRKVRASLKYAHEILQASLCETTTDALESIYEVLGEQASKVSRGMDSQSWATVSVSLMEIRRTLEDVRESSTTGVEAQHTTIDFVVNTLIRAMAVSQDACVALHAVQCIAVMAMRRLDSTDSSVVSTWLYEVLLLDVLSASAPDGVWRRLRIARPPEKDRAACLKVRVMDVMLCFCDYDTGSMTLRNVDNYFQRRWGASLFTVLQHLCKPQEEPVVQVATLHLIGHVVVSLYPRITVKQVVQLCKDVFRHTQVEMARPACAAMLGQVMETLCTEHFLEAVTHDVNLEEVREVASGMESYVFPPQCLAAASAADPARGEVPHDEVVRCHGRAILSRLRNLCSSVVVTDEAVSQKWLL